MYDTTIKKEFTPEEITELEKNTNDFLESKIPLLRKQVKYEELLFKIDNYRYNREVIKIRLAEMKAPDESVPNKK